MTDAIASGRRLTHDEALALAQCDDLAGLMAFAEERCLAGHGRTVSFSKKVFIPLTRLCQDVCHYCTFAQPPRAGEAHYLSPDAVLEIARAGKASGCKEALLTVIKTLSVRQLFRQMAVKFCTCGHVPYLAGAFFVILC